MRSLDARARGESGEVVGRDAERKSADAHRAVMGGDLVARAVDAQAQDALAAVEELDDVGAGVEADQVGAEHSLEQFRAPRKDPEDLLGRKRDVPEESDREVRTLLAQQARHQRKVEVLHPHHVVVGGFGWRRARRNSG